MNPSLSEQRHQNQVQDWLCSAQPLVFIDSLLSSHIDMCHQKHPDTFSPSKEDDWMIDSSLNLVSEESLHELIIFSSSYLMWCFNYFLYLIGDILCSIEWMLRVLQETCLFQFQNYLRMTGFSSGDLVFQLAWWASNSLI